MTRAVAWVLALISALCAIGDTLVVSAYDSLWSADTLGLHGWPFVDAAGLGCSILGAVIVMTYPRHLIGWLLSIVGITTCMSLVLESYSRWVVDHGGPGSDAAGQVSASVSLALGGPFALSVLGVIFLTVPDGELVSPRWRPVAWASCLGYALSLAGLLATPPAEIVSKADATAGMSIGELLSSIGIVITAVALLTAVVSMIVRLRRSTGERRQQLRWVVTAAIFVGLALTAILLDQSLSSDGQQDPVTSIPLYLAYVALIASIAISVLRFRLYDLDIIISRAVALACATAFVTAAYVIAVVVVGDRLDGEAQSFGLSLAITAVVSLAFQPLRRWVLRLADRLAYGPRAQPYDALAAFSRRAGESPAPHELLPAVAEAAGLAASALECTVRLDLPAGAQRTASWPSRPVDGESGTWVEVPVADQAGELGTIALRIAAARNLRRQEERLLNDIAGQAAVAFRNVRLEVSLGAHVQQLHQQTEELNASRARLIRASDSERHRLESAIADQVLSRLRNLRSDLAAVPDSGPDPAQAAEFVTAATTTLECLRELTKGLHPTLLTRSGLAAALSSYVGRDGGTADLVIEPEVRERRWPDRVEAAAYFCCTHAIADAGVTVVRLSVAPGTDELQVALVGGHLTDEVRQSMVDRVEALRGSLEDDRDGVVIRLPRTVEPSAVASG